VVLRNKFNGGINIVENNNSVASKIPQKRFGCLQVFGILVLAVIITAGATIFLVKTYFFPSEFKPVTLNVAEEKVLAKKLEGFDSMKPGVASQKIDTSKNSSKRDRIDPNATIEPEPYNEKGLKREIGFTERELNGLLAKNTDLAQKLAIDLSDDLISAKFLLPVDEDFPILGGKILRLKSGLVFKYTNGKPVIILKGISIMGVPIPNAWLGGIKNIDLVEKFGADKGVWKAFSDGVESVQLEEGLLMIKLKE
jgi:hypothetical protein